MAKTKGQENIYGEVDSAEDVRNVSRQIREDMDGVKSREQLTELKKRGDYFCTLAEARRDRLRRPPRTQGSSRPSSQITTTPTWSGPA